MTLLKFILFPPKGDLVMTTEEGAPASAGLSSFNLLDEQKFFTALALKPRGSVAIVEFYKKPDPPGPPLSWRLSPSELQEMFIGVGYRGAATFKVGLHNYLSLFSSTQ